MCIIFFSYKNHPQYKMILAANRDEFYKRPTKSAKFWDDYPNVLGGRDLEKKGTWMAIERDGKYGAVTNYRDFSLLKKDPLSRGNLVKDYLTNNLSPEDYLEKIQRDREKYNPYNLILGNIEELYYYSNIENQIKKIAPGIYGLSNHFFDSDWPKINRGKKVLRDLINDNNIDTKKLFEILEDDVKAEDKYLPDTGIGLEWEWMLSPIFIKSPNYGTRASTILLIDNNNYVTFVEKSFVDEDKEEWNTKFYEFKIHAIQ